MYVPFSAEHAHARIQQLRVEAENARAVAHARSARADLDRMPTTTSTADRTGSARTRPSGGGRWMSFEHW
jgi:hypothetical protein